MLLENFLKLGAPDEVVFTDLINSHMCGQMTFQVVGNTVENLGIALAFGRFRCLGLQKLLWKNDQGWSNGGSDGSGNAADIV